MGSRVATNGVEIIFCLFVWFVFWIMWQKKTLVKLCDNCLYWKHLFKQIHWYVQFLFLKDNRMKSLLQPPRHAICLCCFLSSLITIALFTARLYLSFAVILTVCWGFSHGLPYCPLCAEILYSHSQLFIYCFSPIHHSALVWFLVFEEQKDRADNAKCGTQLRDKAEKEAWAWQRKGITGCDCKRQRTILIYTKNSNNCESQTKGLQTQQWNKKALSCFFLFFPFFLVH